MRGALLGGVDVFHLHNDGDMRARGLAGNHCAFALTLAGRIDEHRLEARLANAVRRMPELTVELHRFPRPRWVVPSESRGAPRVRVREASDEGGLARVLERMLEERVDGSRPWAMDVVREREHDSVVLRWFHSLADGKGAERLLRWLGSGDGDSPEAPPPSEDLYETSERPIRKLDRETRIALARAYGVQMTALGKTPILSLASAKPRRSPGHQRFVRVTLSPEETAAFDKRVREKARLAETSVMLLAATRLCDAALLRRGFAPPQHLVPVPLSLDPKMGSGRLFGNHITMMMLSMTRDDLRDEARGIAHLAEQQREIVRKKLDLGMAAALDFARFVPRLPYRWLATRPFGGETASLVVSNPGSIALTTFAGLEVKDAFPLPSMVLPPGFQVIFTRFAGRLTALLVYLDGVVGDVEAQGMGDALRADLTGEARAV